MYSSDICGDFEDPVNPDQGQCSPYRVKKICGAPEVPALYFPNAAQTATDTCPEGSSGDPISVTIAANTVFSGVSVADANALALAQAEAEVADLREATPCVSDGFSPPSVMAPFANSYGKGFAFGDFDDSEWNTGLTTEGPAAFLRSACMSDDGIWMLAGGDASSGGSRYFVLKRDDTNAEGFIRITPNMTGVDSLNGLLSRQHAIGRDGIFACSVIVGGVAKSALWKDGPDQPPIVNDEPNYFCCVSSDSRFAWGYQGPNGTNDIIRYELATALVETIPVGYAWDSFLPVRFSADGNRCAAYARSDDGFITLYTRDEAGVWAEDGVLSSSDLGGDEFPQIEDFDGNGTICIGYNFSIPVYWDLTIPAVAGVRQAIALPDLADPTLLSEYGPSQKVMSISSDGTVIIGQTDGAYLLFWIASDGFAAAHLVQDRLESGITGPNLAQSNAFQEPFHANLGEYNSVGINACYPQISSAGKILMTFAQRQVPPINGNITSIYYTAPLKPFTDVSYP